MTPAVPIAGSGGSRRATSADVARAIGVSRATVSYVLNNRTDKAISEQTRQRVLAKAAELGHVPDASARALRKGRSTVVLGLVPGFTVGTIFDEMLEHMSRHVADAGYALLLFPMPAAPDAVQALQELSQHLHPAVVAVLGGAFDAETIRDLGDVVNSSIVSDADIIDHVAIGRLQGEYLIERGHTRIAFASTASVLLHPIAAQRAAGVASACASAGLAHVDGATVSDDVASTTALIHRWLADDVTAIACYNDDIAIRVMLAMHELGLTDGKDLSLIGVDNSPLSQLGITTVAADPSEVGRLVADRVLRKLGDRVEIPFTGDVMQVVPRRSA
ncbi:LacI family DNA-binding transcriptional regulator [Microbacterium sp. LMC-P-041]|uniref:LacI family DNA-binding transcriptional regulator n=1 Tax=Microbacterium sp. LMC-P-041 TaxID=3040293 RepID=UPI002556BA1E|nr:LacI family DNA-binding transcriptional regulator [Microbacterium sp. LMC-P-041]